jgi:hypothetical protein
LTTPKMRAEGLTFERVQSPTEVYGERDHVYLKLLGRVVCVYFD